MTIPTLKDDISAQETIIVLNQSGCVLLDTCQTEKEFHKLCYEIGQILLITPVKVSKNADSPTLFSYKPMKGHTDPPVADYVAWHCVKEGLRDEDTLYVDTKAILDSYDDSTIKELSGIQCRVPDGSPVPTRIHLEYENHTVIEKKGGRFLLNYTPYLRFLVETKEQATAIEKLTLDFDKLCESPYNVHLHRGQSLLLDNRRILHWRTELSPSSPRCHYRYLISKRKPY